MTVLGREIARREVVVLLCFRLPAIAVLVHPERGLLLFAALRAATIGGRIGRGTRHASIGHRGLRVSTRGARAGVACGRIDDRGARVANQLRRDAGSVGVQCVRSAAIRASPASIGLVVAIVVEVGAEAANVDLVIERVVRVDEIGKIRVEPLRVFVILTHVLGAVLRVADENGTTRLFARVVLWTALRQAIALLFEIRVELRAQIVDELFVRFSIRRLHDHEQRCATAKTRGLVLVGFQPGAIERQELAKIRPQLQTGRVHPRAVERR